VIIRAVAYVVRRIQLWRAWRGAYGDEVRWALELVEEDPKTRAYVNLLDKNEVKEIRVIAESKEDVRTMIEERARQHL
jgi:cell division protein FtsB